MQLVLEPLAYYLMLKGKRDIAIMDAQDAIKEHLERVKLGMLPEVFLQLVENTSGLLLEQENGVYSFAHLTFQEYLTATHIREKQLGNILVTNVEGRLVARDDSAVLCYGRCYADYRYMSERESILRYVL